MSFFLPPKSAHLLQMGLKLSAGQLEITETELVLHQRGRQPARWPLRYLKRYGFEAGLFSFEAGRKTPTGPGVYAFKCRRAENLFNLLQGESCVGPQGFPHFT